MSGMGFRPGRVINPERRRRSSAVGNMGPMGVQGVGLGGGSTGLSIKWKFVRDDKDDDEDDHGVSPAVTIRNSTAKFSSTHGSNELLGPLDSSDAPVIDEEAILRDMEKRQEEDLSALTALLQELGGEDHEGVLAPKPIEEMTVEDIIESIEKDLPQVQGEGSYLEGEGGTGSKEVDSPKAQQPRPPSQPQESKGRMGGSQRSRASSRGPSRAVSGQSTPVQSLAASEAGSFGRRRVVSRGGFSNSSRSTATVQAYMHDHFHPNARRNMLRTAAPRMTRRAAYDLQNFQESIEEPKEKKGDEEGAEAAGLLDDMEQEEKEEKGGKDASRPGSPVILWRPSARVRLALDLPAELLQGDLLRESDDESDYDGYFDEDEYYEDEMMSQYTYDSDLYYFHKVWPPVESSFGKYHEPHARRRYGRWYIPPDLWGKELSRREARERGGEVTPEPTEPLQEGVTLRTLWQEKPLTDQQKQEKAMAAQILTVHSSKMYKAYIRDNHYRVPHYLQRVETPPKANPGKSKKDLMRGNSFWQDGDEMFPPVNGAEDYEGGGGTERGYGRTRTLRGGGESFKSARSGSLRGKSGSATYR